MTALVIHLGNEAETHRLSEDLAMAVRRGDLITLSGDLGAGKTSLARALIRTLADDPMLEVPSPTFTLVQTYTDLSCGSLAHMDFYRLESPQEVEELAVDDALADGIVVAEWPERARGSLPPASLEIGIEAGPDDESRVVSVSGQPDALARLQRTLDIREFLARHGFTDARRRHLTGDASTRAYETLHSDNRERLIVMNAPTQPDGPPLRDGRAYSQIAKLAEDMRSYIGVAKALSDHGFRPPKIHVQDLDAGLFVIEDLGSGSIIDKNRAPIPDRYLACIDVLAAMHGQDWDPVIPLPHGGEHRVPEFDAEAMLIEVELLPEWYARHRLGRPLSPEQRKAFDVVWTGLIDRLQNCEKSLQLRDFHSPNVIWCDDATGTDRVGLIDFQDALIGPTAYDVASIAQDARVDVPADLERQLVEHYCTARHSQGTFDEEAFRAVYAIMAAQRATKVAGIFVRLSLRDGKHTYLDHLPRIEDYLRRSLAHPALADYASWVKTVLAW